MIADQYATKKEAAQLLGVSQVTVWHWITNGKLSAERIGREVLIKRSDLVGITRSSKGRKSKKES